MTQFASTAAACLAAIAAFASPALAQNMGVSFSGAELSYMYTESDQDYSSYIYSGSAEVAVGPALVQLDFLSSGYDGEWDYDALTLHLGYAITPDISAGVFYSEEDWGDDDNYPLYGVEMAYEAGPIMVDAAYGRYEDNNSSNIYFDFLMAEGLYRINDRFSAGGYLANTFNSDYNDDLTVVGLIGRYDSQLGLFAELGLFSMSGDDDQDIISIEFGYAIGNGVTFDHRSWNNILRQY